MRYSLYDLPLLVLWLGWLACWLVASWYVKPTHRKESWATRLLTIVFTLPAAVVLAVPGSRLPGWLSWLSARFLPDTAMVYWLGLLIVTAGIAFAVWARVYLGRNWSGTVTVKQDHELICSGPYAIVRHPIYTGLLIAILGTAVVFGEWRGLIALCFLTVAYLFKLRREERFMAESFPDVYPGYRARVPALIPFFSGRSGRSTSN